MTWLLRLGLWATLLAWPCWKLTGPWQWGLGQAAAAVLRGFGLDVTFGEVALSAPMDIGFYAALCLAGRESRRERARVLGLGILVLVGVELAALLLTIGVYVAGGGASGSELALRWTGHLLETVPWVSAAGVWWFLVGARRFGHLLDLSATPGATGRRNGREPRTSGPRPPRS